MRPGHAIHHACVDLVNNWSVGGRTQHMDVRYHFLRDLKLDGHIVVRHVPTAENSVDPFAKNLAGPVFAQPTSREGCRRLNCEREDIVRTDTTDTTYDSGLRLSAVTKYEYLEAEGGR